LKWNQSRLLQDSFDLVKPFLLESQISVCKPNTCYFSRGIFLA